MIDRQLARLRAHRSNIQRYRNLLQTSLTELERQFVEKRLNEEQSNLESVANSLPRDFRWAYDQRPRSHLAEHQPDVPNAAERRRRCAQACLRGGCRQATSPHDQKASRACATRTPTLRTIRNAAMASNMGSSGQ